MKAMKAVLEIRLALGKKIVSRSTVALVLSILKQRLLNVSRMKQRVLSKSRMIASAGTIAAAFL